MKSNACNKNEIPIVRIMKVLSGLFACAGLALGISMIVQKGFTSGVVLAGLTVLIALAAAAVLRILGVVAQILFATQAFLYGRLNDMQTRADEGFAAITKQIEILNASVRDGDDTITEKIMQVSKQLNQEAEQLKKETNMIGQNCLKMSCDSKDINTSIYGIKDFFKKIAKRLDINE